MKRNRNNWNLIVGSLALVLGAWAILRSDDLTFSKPANAAARTSAAGLMAPSNPAYAYARLVFTVGGNGVMVWLNTPANAVTATLSKDGNNTLATVADAIRATCPTAEFPQGVAVDDMLLVQWMGLAQWELVAVTQNQVDIGVTTSYYFRRKI